MGISQCKFLLMFVESRYLPIVIAKIKNFYPNPNPLMQDIKLGGGGGLQPKNTEEYSKFQIWDWFFRFF